jgi:dihydropyrimidinase
VLTRNNAQVYGIYPRKGAIRIGSDADFALVDLEQEREVTADYMQSAADWDLYEGWTLKGWPTTTIVRGEIVMQDGEIVGDPAHGQYVPRYPSGG